MSKVYKPKIKVGDKVVVRAGADKGKTGKVLAVNNSKRTVIVEGVNPAKRHKKPTMGQPTGTIDNITLPINISNVGLDDGSGKAVRTAYKVDAKGNKKRVIAGTDKEVK